MEHLSSYHKDRRASPFELEGKSIEIQTTWSEFPRGEKSTVEEILASEKNKSKRALLWESQ